MNIIKVMVPSVVALGIGCLCQSSLVQAVAAESNVNVPPVIQAGFELWAKGGGAAGVLDAWQKGGLLEGDRKVAAQSNYLRRAVQAVGNYNSYDLIEAKRIGLSSQIIYLSINFERGAVYARFVLYRSNKNWVVQNMDFSTQPEAVMPWLSFEGGNYTE